MSRGLIVAKTETEISLENCVLKGFIDSCVRGNCLYWAEDSQSCTRSALKLTEKALKARRARRNREADAVAGGF